MNKKELYQTYGFSIASISQAISTYYVDYIRNEMIRIMGYTNSDMVNHILNDVANRLSEIEVDCELSLLVFDCLRKEVLDMYNKDCNFRYSVNNQLIRECANTESHSQKDDMRLDVVLLLLSAKERTYFLNRYYFLREDVKKNNRYEKTILNLFNGKGLALFRFRYFGIPSKKVSPQHYVDYLNRIDLSCLYRILNNKTVILNNASGISALEAIAERQYSIARYSVPISLLLMIILLIFAVLSEFFL